MKKRRIHKLLSLLLAAVLVAGLFPATVFADDDYEDGVECEYCGAWRYGDWRCPNNDHCAKGYGCGDEHHCPVCEECECDVQWCDNCGMCVECGIEAEMHCPSCGVCWEDEPLCHLCSLCFNCGGTCSEEHPACLECHLEEGLACENCGACFVDCEGVSMCYGCGDCCMVCSDGWCDLCGMCVNCVVDQGLHCPECLACHQMVDHCWVCPLCLDCGGMCSEGEGDICLQCHIEHGLACEECGLCFLINEDKKCPDCGACAECNLWCENCVMCMECALNEGLHCSECEICGEEEPLCENCGLCIWCAVEDGLHCPDCEVCGEDSPLCGTCGRCFDCGEQCDDGCDDECLICHLESDEACDVCGKCFRNDDSARCSQCGQCLECVGTWCENCLACEECATICENGDNCSECAQLCENCGMCEYCADICVNGDGCSECALICENCGCCSNCAEVYEDCSACSECADPEDFNAADGKWISTTPYIVDKTSGEVSGFGSDSDEDDALSSVYIPAKVNGVTVVRIGDNAFANHPELSKLTLPDGVTEIGTGAFANCSNLTNVVIPVNVETIGVGAFDGCTVLKSITFLGDAPTVGINAFPSGVTLYYPDNASGWSTPTWNGYSAKPLSAITYTVSFYSNGGSGDMADVTDVSGDYTLPDCAFTAPKGKLFKCWSVKGTKFDAGDTVQITADTAVKAIWELDVWVAPEIDSTGVSPMATGTATQSTQTVEIDGKQVTLQAYSLLDPETGYPTNYIKIRDIAYALKGSSRPFDVTWDGAVNLVVKSAYLHPNGQENKTPYSGNQTYKNSTAQTKVNGQVVKIGAFIITDSEGGDSTYYKLREVGQAVGFNVGYSFERGIFIETGKPYSAED